MPSNVLPLFLNVFSKSGTVHTPLKWPVSVNLSNLLLKYMFEIGSIRLSVDKSLIPSTKLATVLESVLRLELRTGGCVVR